MNLQLWTMVTLENSLIQIISFHITWFIYKKLTGSSLAYWKVLLISLLGIIVSFGKGDGFYYQVIIFLGLALKERRKHRLTLWASLFLEPSQSFLQIYLQPLHPSMFSIICL